MQRLIYLDAGLALAPSTFRRLTGLIGEARYDERLGPDRFSLREVLAHLADFEPVIRWRIELALSTPGSRIPSFDPDAESVAKNYALWDVEESLNTFSTEREKTFQVLHTVTKEQEELAVLHEQLGELSILDIAAFAIGHDAYHIDQLIQYLRS